MSMASMKAEPMMPNISVTPLAASVSTNASEGVMAWGPVRAAAAQALLAVGSCSLMVGVSGFIDKTERMVPKSAVHEER
ncbi:hypothetical protein BSU04_05760 [Caballeronia sordidicola]|uniref:Uncharacterized protein n=1 Tax=Caballeronia sordidicola TaxID=196367 RepID=A0A226X9Y1_CABSO|nr:hypothetical protein BSU04_05760 [Caballeronia sordidicola]